MRTSADKLCDRQTYARTSIGYAQLHFPLTITVRIHEYLMDGLGELAWTNFVTDEYKLQRATTPGKVNGPELV